MNAFTDILNCQHRWPTKNDRLLRFCDDCNRAVTFNSEIITKHALLWQGYFAAGDGLIQLCLTEGYEHERHTVIYPILHNYRHGLELALKWIIIVHGEGDLAIAPKNHNILELWRTCRRIIEFNESPDKDTDDAIGGLIKQFHDIDKQGIVFRYAYTAENRKIPLPERPIDLENLRSVMQGIANYLSGTDAWLSNSVL